MNRSVIAVAILVLACGAAVPASAEDNGPAPQPQSCPTYEGGSIPSGAVIPRPPGFPPLPGTTGQSGYYVCVNGEWIWSGPIALTGGSPIVTPDAAAVTVDEGATATMTGTVEYDGDVTLTASVGTVSRSADGTWSWSYDAADGPAQQTVVVTATAGEQVGDAVFDLLVANVAPQIVSVVPDRDRVVAGAPVTFAGTATDPSSADAATLTWSFDGAAVAGSTFTTSFDVCGSATVAAIVTDKDGASAPAVVSAPVSVVAAALGGPLAGGGERAVQAGQVVPVRVVVGCDGVNMTGLAPTVELVGAGPPAPMRLLDGAYGANVRVPRLPGGTALTVRVLPFGPGGGAIDAALRVRR